MNLNNLSRQLYLICTFFSLSVFLCAYTDLLLFCCLEEHETSQQYATKMHSLVDFYCLKKMQAKHSIRLQIIFLLIILPLSEYASGSKCIVTNFTVTHVILGGKAYSSTMSPDQSPSIRSTLYISSTHTNNAPMS